MKGSDILESRAIGFLGMIFLIIRFKMIALTISFGIVWLMEQVENIINIFSNVDSMTLMILFFFLLNVFGNMLVIKNQFKFLNREDELGEISFIKYLKVLGTAVFVQYGVFLILFLTSTVKPYGQYTSKNLIFLLTVLIFSFCLFLFQNFQTIYILKKNEKGNSLVKSFCSMCKCFKSKNMMIPFICSAIISAIVLIIFVDYFKMIVVTEIFVLPVLYFLLFEWLLLSAINVCIEKEKNK